MGDGFMLMEEIPRSPLAVGDISKPPKVECNASESPQEAAKEDKPADEESNSGRYRVRRVAVRR